MGVVKTKFIMKAKTLLGHPDEFTVLKSMALGLSCDDIRNLLGLKSEKYESLCRGLFEKLGASNHYTAVKTAYQKKYLDSTEYPNYIRINNFGSKKTGWLTYNPIKVEISPIGDITVVEEKINIKYPKINFMK